MSCGIPWFAPDVGAVSTLKGGIILKKKSSATLEKTVGALTDEKFRARRGQEGLRQWQEQYDPSVVYQQWEDLLSSCLLYTSNNEGVTRDFFPPPFTDCYYSRISAKSFLHILSLIHI